MKIVLTIAGTDPSGAAGIQADLQTIRDHDHHGVSVVTAVLAQNTQGVRSVHPMPSDLVRAQLDAVFDDFDIAAVKVGLVPNDELLDVVLTATCDVPVVWDPVLTSGDGETALFSGTPTRMVEVLRQVDVATPNVPELATLSGAPIAARDDARAAARAFSAAGPALLLKVGHLEHDEMIRDIWAEDGETWDLEPLPAIDADVRGTGCQLSSAIACHLADEVDAREAVERARAYLNNLLHQRARQIGRGRPIVVRSTK